MVEIKSKLRRRGINQLLKTLRRFPEFFPEHRGAPSTPRPARRRWRVSTTLCAFISRNREVGDGRRLGAALCDTDTNGQDLIDLHR